MNTKQLLDQDEIWRTRDGMPIRLVDMDPDHRRSTLAFLRRRAAYLRNAYFFCEMAERLGWAWAQSHVLEELLTDYERSLTDHPEHWLERRPLVIALARLVAEDEHAENVVDGEVVVYALPAGESEAA